VGLLIRHLAHKLDAHQLKVFRLNVIVLKFFEGRINGIGAGGAEVIIDIAEQLLVKDAIEMIINIYFGT